MPQKTPNESKSLQTDLLTLLRKRIEELQTASQEAFPPFADRIHITARETLESLIQQRAEMAALQALQTIEDLPYDFTGFFENTPRVYGEHLREMLEACQRVLLELLFADSSQTDGWRRTLLNGESGSTLPSTLAGLLRRTNSTRLLGPEDELDYDALAQGILEEQAKQFGRFAIQADSVTPFDLQRVQTCVRRELMPQVFAWGLRSYMTSPRMALFASVFPNMQRFQQAFSELLGNPPQGLLLPCNVNFVSSLYRAAYICPSIRAFSEQVSRNVFSTLTDAYIAPGAPAGAARSKDAPYRIGIATRFWNPRHPVHRCLSPLIEGLSKGHRELYWYLVDVPPPLSRESIGIGAEDRMEVFAPPEESEANLPETIDRVYRAMMRDRLDLLFYPEVGMSQSIALLARRRIARVQAVGYGHPVTTGSAQIDYFVGGAAIEDRRSAYEYSERLVLIPGLGVCSTEPPAAPPRRRPLNADPVRLINVSTPHKYTVPMVQTWNEILTRAKTAVELHLFPNGRESEVEALRQRLHGLLPDKYVTIHTKLERRELMSELADGDLYLESFPFGGYNTLVEALSTGMPVVCPWGNRAPSRFGAGIARMMGLPSWLVAKDRRAYVDAALRLIESASERLALRESLSRERAIETLCRGEGPADFAAAVDWMIGEGPAHAGGDRRPVRIEAGNPPSILD